MHNYQILSKQAYIPGNQKVSFRVKLVDSKTLKENIIQERILQGLLK